MEIKFKPLSTRPSHLNYLGDNLAFFGVHGAVGVYYDARTRQGKLIKRTSTVITREDYQAIKRDLESRGLPLGDGGGWR